MPRFSICQEHPFLFPAGAVPSWLLLLQHSRAFAKKPAHREAPVLPQLTACTPRVDTKGHWAWEVCVASPHIPMLAASFFLLGTPLASPEPMCSPSVLVERLLFFSFQNLESWYARHLLSLQFFTSSPWAEDRHCNRGTSPVALSTCGAVCLSCCVFPDVQQQRNVTGDAWFGFVRLVWTDRSQTLFLPPSLAESTMPFFFHACFPHNPNKWGGASFCFPLFSLHPPPLNQESSVVLSQDRFSSRHKMSRNACDSVSEKWCLWLALAGSRMGLGAGFWRLALLSCRNTTAGQDGEEASLRMVPTKATSPAQAAHPQSSTQTVVAGEAQVMPCWATPHHWGHQPTKGTSAQA